MAHVTVDMDTIVAPQAIIGALTDFSERRVELWPNIDRGYYQVHSLAGTSADVTEGSRAVWERSRYDWSEPGTVRLEVLDSNAFRPGSWWRYSVQPLPTGGSHVHLEFDRRPRNVKGYLLGALLGLAGRPIFRKFLAETLRRVERRPPAVTGPTAHPHAPRA